MSRHDVAVVGGGVIGCAVAFSLARAGLSVVLLERDEIGAHASRAAAGMLAPIVESSGHGPMLEAGVRSLSLFPPLVEDLAELSGIDPALSLSGIVRVAEPGEEGELRRETERLSRFDCGWLDADELRKREPGLRADAAGALWSPREGSVDARLLTRAFAGAAVRRGAELRIGTPALGLVRDKDRVTGVRTASEDVACGDVVLCNGAWARFAGDWVGCALPVEPVKGQMISLEPAPPQCRSIIWGSHAYLVPRRDGTLGVGATVEHAGFDATPTAAAVRSLIDAAIELAPRLGAARFRETWAGLRPGTPDALPLIGALPRWRGLYVATGHFRNGVLLAPVTALALVELIVSERLLEGFEAFDPARFSDAG